MGAFKEVTKCVPIQLIINQFSCNHRQKKSLVTIVMLSHLRSLLYLTVWHDVCTELFQNGLFER